MRSTMLVLSGAAVVVVVAVGAWVSPRIGIPVRFWFSPIRTVTVDDRNLHLVEVSYAEGLREVETLGSLDGALFVLDAPVGADSGMGMDDVLLPLDVAFFDASGRLVGRDSMSPCQTGICPGYFPGASWQFAIEAPADSLSWMTDRSRLSP